MHALYLHRQVACSHAATSLRALPCSASMQNIAAIAKSLRRRNRHARVLYDTS